ncbi:efflux RND transporter periplasmic adaptor subunit [Comamonas granuli]|uniref:efflux RND transporter periplasmic adaptor subunit n=1 Tax=Comamonas granuli TaxID=290309 RepID=UPI000A035D72|nr:efflux RND transporter periplasmic adaptor subunit [Comamonas granuli]
MRTSSAPRPRQGLFLVSAARPGAQAAAAAAALALLAACTPAEPVAEPVRAVKLLTVGASALQAEQEYAGEVRARVESRLGFRVAGKLVERPAQLGQRVQAGQVLAQLDPQDYQLSAAAARAQVAAAQTQYDLAAADFQRFAKLQEQNFISGAELERRESALKAARSQLQQAQAQAQAQGHQAQYTRLLADAAGVITAIEAEPGQVVAAGTPVLRLAQDGARDVVFAVPEDKVARLRAGQPVQVRAWATGASLPGTVREVAASADPVTRTFTVKVDIAAASAPPLGSTVYVAPQALAAQGQQAIKLPTTALRQEGQATAVWVYEADKGTVRSQAVQVATADGNEAVIVGGLTPGMQVVSTGVHVLTPGQKVVVYQQKSAPGQSGQAQAATKTVANGAAPAAASSAQ